MLNLAGNSVANGASDVRGDAPSGCGGKNGCGNSGAESTGAKNAGDMIGAIGMTGIEAAQCWLRAVASAQRALKKIRMGQLV